MVDIGKVTSAFTRRRLRLAGTLTGLAVLVPAGLVAVPSLAPAAAASTHREVPAWLKSPDTVRMSYTSGGNCKPGSAQYYWVSAISTLPLFVANDFPVLFATAKELKVCAHVVGPSAMDISGDFAAIEETCAQHPAGVMVVGLDASLAAGARDWRAFQSVGLTPETCTLTRTCPGPGSGSGRSARTSTSGPPLRV